jgi:RND family efflux transporter MFP subunit
MAQPSIGAATAPSALPAPTRLRRRRLAAAAAFLALVLPATPLLAQANSAPTVPVARPITRDIVEWNDVIGRFEAVDGVDLRARVNGYLDSVHFKDGDVVEAGALLFTIDPRSYRAALQEAEAAVASARARRDFAVTDLGRADDLRRTGFITQQIADQRRETLQTARAELDRAEAALVRARLDVSFTEVRAPVGGRMSRRLVSTGTLINANDTIMANIVSLNPIQFYFDLDERTYLSALSTPDTLGKEVFVSLTDEKGQPRRGRIDFVDNRLDAASGTMRGRAVFDNADMSLVPGLFGRMRLPVSRSYTAVLIPDEALGTDQDRRIVYVVGPDNKATVRAVRPGPRSEGYRVIREGLKGDETIVVSGLSRVQPGASIQPRMTELAQSRTAPATIR